MQLFAKGIQMKAKKRSKNKQENAAYKQRSL